MSWYSQISKVSKRVFVLTPPHFYSYLFAGEDLAIVDTGPSEKMIPWVPPEYPVILNSIDIFDFDKSSVKWVLLTEPHPDHIGGLENLLDELPNAKVATSKKNCDEIEILKGKDHKVLNEGDEIDLRGARIRAIATPGHSEGQTSYYEVNDGAVASGDTMGFIYLREEKFMIPAPFYDFRLCLESMEKIRKLKPKIVLTGHNGAITGSYIEEYLDASEKSIRNWEKAIMDELMRPKTLDQLNDALVKTFPEMALCPNPHQSSMITEAITRVLEAESRIKKEIVEDKVFLKSV